MNDNDKFDDEFDWDDLALGPSRVFKIAIWSIAAAFIAALCVLVFFAATARAAAPPSPVGQCAPFSAISKALKDVAHEDQVAGGLINGENALVIFATPKGETWTAVLVTVNDDRACILNMGVGWFPVRTPKGDPV